MSSITPEFLKQRAREIAYALTRISFYIKRSDLRDRLERLSFEFLENVAVSSEDASDKQSLLKVFKNIAALDVLVRIGHSLYEIEPVNANILIREIDSFNSAIRQFGNSAIENPFAGELPNLETIFSMPPAVIEDQVVSGRRAASEMANIDKEKEIVERAYSSASSNVADEEDIPAIRQSGNLAIQQVDSSISIRQGLITDKIRQLGRANLKDLVARFPGVSERTLRYDIQKLCDQGLVEKVGNGGPGTGYVLKGNI
ncbi:MAG: DeoR family transcriptional regulator [Patescibacteria group bacterium]|nr:DeoR family transcriptional regulator [Patescibacteria group bacterium]